MKFPRIFPVLGCMFLSCIYGQSQSLIALPASFYSDNDASVFESALHSNTNDAFFQAFEVAELEDILGESGPFTIFAPTDTAFSKFSPAELKELFRVENRKKLKNLLSYHIVAGNLTASYILRALCRGEGKTSFTTIQGNKIFARIQGTDILLTNGTGHTAMITVADSEHPNGVVHQIDGVIVPPGL